MKWNEQWGCDGHFLPLSAAATHTTSATWFPVGQLSPGWQTGTHAAAENRRKCHIRGCAFPSFSCHCIFCQLWLGPNGSPRWWVTNWVLNQSWQCAWWGWGGGKECISGETRISFTSNGSGMLMWSQGQGRAKKKKGGTLVTYCPSVAHEMARHVTHYQWKCMKGRTYLCNLMFPMHFLGKNHRKTGLRRNSVLWDQGGNETVKMSCIWESENIWWIKRGVGWGWSQCGKALLV